jgi:hypothetical protein
MPRCGVVVVVGALGFEVREALDRPLDVGREREFPACATRRRAGRGAGRARRRSGRARRDRSGTPSSGQGRPTRRRACPVRGVLELPAVAAGVSGLADGRLVAVIEDAPVVEGQAPSTREPMNIAALGRSEFSSSTAGDGWRPRRPARGPTPASESIVGPRRRWQRRYRIRSLSRVFSGHRESDCRVQTVPDQSRASRCGETPALPSCAASPCALDQPAMIIARASLDPATCNRLAHLARIVQVTA